MKSPYMILNWFNGSSEFITNHTGRKTRGKKTIDTVITKSIGMIIQPMSITIYNESLLFVAPLQIILTNVVRKYEKREMF